jgi:hypothetical protein
MVRLSSKVRNRGGGANSSLSEANYGGDLGFDSGMGLPIGTKPAILSVALQLRAETAHLLALS